MHKRTLSDLRPSSLEDEVVVVRLDLNAPLQDGEVADATRLEAVLPTLRHLLDAGSHPVLLSHLGRPQGKVVLGLSLRPVAARLEELLGAPVNFLEDSVGQDVSARVSQLERGEVLLLENTRFLPGETTNDPGLAKFWASLGTVYVNDAFGAAHRAHASTEGVARTVVANGGVAVAGRLMERELDFLGRITGDPERPFVAVLGGAKISGKIDVVEALLGRVDRLVIGGAMANTFFLALGLETGDSLVEEERVQTAREVLERAGDRLVLPVDARVATSLEEDTAIRVTERTGVRPGESIGDIGPASESLFAQVLHGARTVLWNGPMGIFERVPFASGTVAVARQVAAVTEAGALSVVGGGDSAAAVAAAGVSDRVSHVSTGGGASLEYLAGRTLPGVAALSDREV